MPRDDSDIQPLVGPQLTRLADTLGDRPDIADAPSLCQGWTVTHVVAHMTMAARYDEAAFMAELEAAGYDFDRLSETVARRDGLLPFERLLDDLRSDTMARWAPPGGGATGALAHAVIHGLDITSALGIGRTCDDDACRLLLDSLAADDGARFGLDTSGRRLRATDLDWQHGAGEPVDAAAADLILALAGRPRPGIEFADAT
ncbi:MAG: maleylpyruvate isomerase family mycothiol-dependent enzyme [Ilumatobacteraceae bacterium]